MIRRYLLLIAVFVLAVAGCARTWDEPSIDGYRTDSQVPPASVCQTCHKDQYDSWKKNRHGSEEYMSRIPVKGLHECEACHTNTSAHAQNPSAAVPTKIAGLPKTEQNNICGKCHYSQKLFGRKAINPHDKHAIYKSVGFEGFEKQLSCLDCHSGHRGRSEMLQSAKAHICFKCHKSAIATMGVFQPLNYLFFGKACQACHTVHGGSKGERWGRMGAGVCVVCHFVGVALVD